VRLFAFCLPVLCLAQVPVIGVVEIYGARKTTPAAIRKVSGLVPGSKLPASKGIAEEQLLRLPAVRDASVEATCCDAGRIILYIGIAEKDSKPLVFREAPAEGPDIPEEVTTAYQQFLARVNDATRAGVAGEDLTKGHSLMNYAPARETQESFVGLATRYVAELREVLRTSASEDHRAMAAYVLGYHDDKKMVVEDLVYALRDGDATVRENAIRALAAIGAYAQGNPGAGITVDAAPLAEMLTSVFWTDRNSAAVALASMTESRKLETLATIRKEALPSLVEMARWKHEPHALPAYILLGRTSGIPEADLQSAWAKGEREQIIARASTQPASPAKTQSTPPDRP
jgi:hypothetical protein